MSATETQTTTEQLPTIDIEPAPPSHKEPLKLSGALNKYTYFDVTPIIGREYPDVKLKELLEAENSDELLRDLAITSILTNLSQ